VLDLILDGECHNGRNAERLGPRHWRLEARGDDAHYCYYFHFTLRASSAGEAILDIRPDSSLLPQSAESFRRHRPESLWVTRGGRWVRHAIADDGTVGALRLRLDLAAGETVAVSRMRPYPYSAAVARVSALAERPGAHSLSLGQSAEGREIAALEIGAGTEEVLVLAGQHPAEFGGTEAVLGIADWLLSRLPEAESARAEYRFLLVPVLNPDGNVGGRCGRNARGDDLYRAFPDAAAGARPAAPEAAALWDRAQAQPPLLSLNFHTYPQPSPGGGFPWEGLYTPPDAAFASDAARERQRRLDDCLAWETDGLSHSGDFARHAPAAFESQLAARGIPTVFYELQDATGPAHQRRAGVHVLRAALGSLIATS
jgi:hypothetical protein